MYAEGILQGDGIDILLQSLYLGEINTQHFILGSNEFLLQKKEFMLILMILGEIICGSDPQSLAGRPEIKEAEQGFGAPRENSEFPFFF